MPAEHHRQLLDHAGRQPGSDHFGSVQRGGVEELQRGHVALDGHRLQPSLIAQMDKEVTHFLGAHVRRRAHVVESKGMDASQIASLGGRPEVTKPEVGFHTVPKFTHGTPPFGCGACWRHKRRITGLPMPGKGCVRTYFTPEPGRRDRERSELRSNTNCDEEGLAEGFKKEAP